MSPLASQHYTLCIDVNFDVILAFCLAVELLFNRNNIEQQTSCKGPAPKLGAIMEAHACIEMHSQVRILVLSATTLMDSTRLARYMDILKTKFAHVKYHLGGG
jgi:hypothetical protein